MFGIKAFCTGLISKIPIGPEEGCPTNAPSPVDTSGGVAEIEL